MFPSDRTLHEDQEKGKSTMAARWQGEGAMGHP